MASWAVAEAGQNPRNRSAAVRVSLIEAMGVLRRRVWFAAIILSCQLAGFASAPALVAFGVAAGIEDDCGCPNVAPGQMCPMHHHSRKGNDDGTCKMRSGCQPPEVALLSMAGGPGVLPRATEQVIVFDVAMSVDGLAPSIILRASRPESPPPRA